MKFLAMILLTVGTSSFSMANGASKRIIASCKGDEGSTYQIIGQYVHYIEDVLYMVVVSDGVEIAYELKGECKIEADIQHSPSN